MARLYNQFEFIGEIAIPNDKDKFHQIIKSQNNKNWEGHRLNFGVKESKTNSVFVELFDGCNKDGSGVVYSFGKGTESEKGEKLQIPWADRLKESTLDMVADFKKVVVDLTEDQDLKQEIDRLRYDIRTLEYKKDDLSDDDKAKLKELKEELKEKATDRQEFVAVYDAIAYLTSILPEYQDKKFRLTGAVEWSEYKGKFYKKYHPELIEIVPQDTKNKLRATIDIFFNKDAVDETSFKEDKKIYIDGYVQSYDSKAKKDMFFPEQFVLNGQKVDFENEMHKKRFEFLKKKFEIKGKYFHHLQWEVNIVRGAERVEFTYDDLTQIQKEAVDFDMNKVEDFAPRGGMLGENIEELRVVRPTLDAVNKDNDFSDGAVETDLTEEDILFETTEDEKIEDIVKKESEIKEDTSSKLEEDLDDIFA